MDLLSGRGFSHVVAAIAMAAAMIVEKCILSGCVLKVMLYWLLGQSGVNLGWSRRLCEARDASYKRRRFPILGTKLVLFSDVGFGQSSFSTAALTGRD